MEQKSTRPTPIDTTPAVPAQPQGETDYSQPVAYDTQGRPLYLQPSAPATQPQFQQADPQPQSEQNWSPAFNPQSHGNHQYVHVSRPIAPANPEIPDDIMRRYDESCKRYPQLNLSRGEFIISAIRRHPFGLVQIWGVAVIFLVVLAIVMTSFISGNQLGSEILVLSATGLGLVSFFIFIGALIATYVYNNNRFYLTNESVIQEIMMGIFNKHEQTVSLANIEDASFYKSGIFSYMFDFGTIRLSTEGDETTYRFSYVKNPKRQIAILNNAVEAFKNGRPVDANEEN